MNKSLGNQSIHAFHWRAALVALVAAMLVMRAAQAQVADDNAWRFNITPYIWLPSINTTLGNHDVPFKVDANTEATDIFHKLDVPILVCGEVQAGKFGLLYDFQFLKFSDSGTVRSTRAGLDTGFTFADSTLGLEYRVVDQPKAVSVDAFGGARAIYAKTKIEIDPAGRLPSFGGDRDRIWVDPIVGMKARWQFAPNWSLGAYGDVGGFGVSSELTYQVMGVVGYHFNDHIALMVGYRYFYDRYDRDSFSMNAKAYGPIVGLSFTF